MLFQVLVILQHINHNNVDGQVYQKNHVIIWNYRKHAITSVSKVCSAGFSTRTSAMSVQHGNKFIMILAHNTPPHAEYQNATTTVGYLCSIQGCTVWHTEPSFYEHFPFKIQ